MTKPDDLKQEMVDFETKLVNRRDALKAGALVGAASAFGLMATDFAWPVPGRAASPTRKQKDEAKVLNVALALEYQGIYAYEVASKTGLLEGSLKDVARLFQSQHEEHARLEEEAVRSLGAATVDRKSQYDLGDLSGIKTANDLLAFALGLEAGAASAYMSVLPSLARPEHIALLAGIGANEAQHAALLRYVLKQNPVPLSVVK